MMMVSNRVRAVAVALLTVAMLAGACGSDAAPTTTGATTAPSTMAPPTSGSTTSTDATTTSSATTVPPSTAPASTGSTTEPVADQPVQVFYSTGDGSDCAEVTGFERLIADGFDPVIMAFDLLVAGPTAEEVAAGAGSFFSEESAGTINSVLLEDGTLTIDFSDVRVLLSNASTSCGSGSLLAQLNATAFQFESIDRTRYEIEGSCDRFSEWLQRECTEYTRSGEEPGPTATDERASGSGCLPGTDELSDGRWFGFVADADENGLRFDLACWFSGSAAVDAAAEDGEESPPPNDYHIRNVSDLLRDVGVAASVPVGWLPIPGDPASTETIAYEQWRVDRVSREFQPGIWLEIRDGEAAIIEEQYVP